MKLDENHFESQPNSYTCAPAVIRIICRVLSIAPPPYDTLVNELGTNSEVGTSTHAVSSYLARIIKLHNLSVQLIETEGMTLHDLQRARTAGELVLICFRDPKDYEGHFALVLEASTEALRLADPHNGYGFQIGLNELDWRTDFETPERRGWSLRIRKSKESQKGLY